MRTRMVRVRRKPRTVVWAVLLMLAAMALYIRVSLPMLNGMREQTADAVSRGERVTREIVIDALNVYLVSFGGYNVESGARVEAARYVSRGAAGYVLDDDQLEVIGAGYATREEAEKVCAQLRTEEGLNCKVIERSCPRVAMRITAGTGQIEAFVNAEQVLRSAASALGQLSFSIDRREATVDQAADVIRTQRDRAHETAKTLRAQSEGSDHPLFSGVAEILEEAEQQMQQMLEETSAMTLSSRLKFCHVDLRVREIDKINQLAG